MAIKANDIVKKVQENAIKGGLHYEMADSYREKFMKGHPIAILTDVNTGEETYIDLEHNIIVDTASVLLARLMKDNTEPLSGARVLALGTGAPTWDLQNPPEETTAQTQLESELIRKEFQSVNFIDSLGAISVVPTNVVDFTTLFLESEAVGPLVEMGLIGDLPAGGVGTGTLINYRTFPVINKPNTSTLTITFRLTF